MRRRRCSVCGRTGHDARAHRRNAQPIRRRNPERRRNVDGFVDEYGRFRPVRHSPAYDEMAAGDVIGRRGTPGYRGRMSYVRAQREYHGSLPAQRSPPGQGPYSLRERIGRIAAAARARARPRKRTGRGFPARQHAAYARMVEGQEAPRKDRRRVGFNPPRRAR